MQIFSAVFIQQFDQNVRFLFFVFSDSQTNVPDFSPILKMIEF